MDKISIENSVFIESKNSSEISRQERPNCCMRDKNCARHSVTRKDMLRHLKNDHLENGDGLTITPFQANEPTIGPMVWPATDCNMTSNR